MSGLSRLFVVLGAANAALVVVLGALGAHFLEARLTGERMATYQTGVLYHAIHALGLIAVGAVAARLPRSRWLGAAGWTMTFGIVAFSGSLYLLSLTGARWLGAVTPVGGIAFVAAWILLCVAVLRSTE